MDIRVIPPPAASGTITEGQEEILSYLCGLAPIGTPLQVPHKWIVADLDSLDHSSFCKFVLQLVKRGAVEIVARGMGATPSVLRVLQRPEAFAVVKVWRRSA